MQSSRDSSKLYTKYKKSLKDIVYNLTSVVKKKNELSNFSSFTDFMF